MFTSQVWEDNICGLRETASDYSITRIYKKRAIIIKKINYNWNDMGHLNIKISLAKLQICGKWV